VHDLNQLSRLNDALGQLATAVVSGDQLVPVLSKLMTLQPGPLAAFLATPYQLLQAMQARGAPEAQVQALAQKALTDLLHS
jgi:hypothetical protein